MKMPSATIADLILNLQMSLVDRPLVDQTGLVGRWNIELKWTPDEASLSADGGDHPSLFVALQQQLGLKLVAQKAPVRVLVIDHVEKPSEN